MFSFYLAPGIGQLNWGKDLGNVHAQLRPRSACIMLCSDQDRLYSLCSFFFLSSAI